MEPGSLASAGCAAMVRGVDMAERVFTAVIHREEDLYVAECPEVGTVSQGHTIEEAIANLKEATELYLEEFPSPAFARPILAKWESAGKDHLACAFVCTKFCNALS
jgi:predicted RNase H-like HicB family nuclease